MDDRATGDGVDAGDAVLAPARCGSGVSPSRFMVSILSKLARSTWLGLGEANGELVGEDDGLDAASTRAHTHTRARGRDW